MIVPKTTDWLACDTYGTGDCPDQRWDVSCPVQHPREYWFCVKPEGHKGEHIGTATHEDGRHRVFARWPNASDQHTGKEDRDVSPTNG